MKPESLHVKLFIFYYKYLKYRYNLGEKTVLYLICNRINGFVGSIKQKSRTASVNTDGQWSKQEAYFARVTQVWLTVNHNTQYHFWHMRSMFEAYCTGK